MNGQGMSETELLILAAVGGYLAYSWYTSTGLFAPSAAATTSTTAAATTPTATTVATPVTTTSTTTPAAAPLTPGGAYSTSLTRQGGWRARSGSQGYAAWSATGTYVEGEAISYSPAAGVQPLNYVNLTGNSTATPPNQDTTNWALFLPSTAEIDTVTTE